MSADKGDLRSRGVRTEGPNGASEHPVYVDDEDGTGYVREDAASDAEAACAYVATLGFDYPDGTTCEGLVGMRPHVHDAKCMGGVVDRLPCLEKCPACGASVGRRNDSDYWRCDNGHTIYRGNEKDAPVIGCWRSDLDWYDECPEDEAPVRYWKVVA
jgi:ribosomal protein L37AE/L43A